MTHCGDRSNTIPKENTPLDVQEWIKAIASISASAPQAVVAEIESVSANLPLFDHLQDQYDKIDIAIGTADNVDMTKGTLRIKINGAKNLGEAEKANLLAYIDTK